MARRKVREMVAGSRNEPVVTARQVIRAYRDKFGREASESSTVASCAAELIESFGGDRMAALEYIVGFSNEE